MPKTNVLEAAPKVETSPSHVSDSARLATCKAIQVDLIVLDDGLALETWHLPPEQRNPHLADAVMKLMNGVGEL
jgi:hypothetical protein